MEYNATTFIRFAECLNSATTIEDAARIALEFADAVCRWDTASVVLRTTDNTFRPVLSVGKSVQTESDTSLTHEPDDPAALYLRDKQYASQSAARIDSLPSGRSQIIAPILIASGSIGYLSIVRNGDSTYGEEDRQMIQKVVAFSAAALDRFLLQETLKSNEHRFHLLTENALDSIAELNIDGTIRYYGQSSERVIGWDPEDLEGVNALDLIHPDDLSKIRELFQDLLRNPASIRTAEYRFRHKNGTWCVIESVGKCIPDLNGVPRLIVNSRDITERRKLEARLSTAARMETIGKLAGGIAHDCNNIFMAISCFTELVEAKLEQRNLKFGEVAEIKKATSEGAGLVQKLLAFGQKQIFVPAILDVNQMLRETSESLAALIGRSNELRLNLQEGLGRVKADRNLLTQAVMNLCANARDAIVSDGWLQIRTQDVTLDGEFVRNHIGSRAGEYVLLEIQDSGCGMSDEVLGHVFEPFYTTKDPAKGVGLGLSSVYGIVKQTQGYITCESQKGIGTTFQIFLPRLSKLRT